MYKLIKEYPGSPKVGSIIYPLKNTNIYNYNGVKINPEQYPEFWTIVSVLEVPIGTIFQAPNSNHKFVIDSLTIGGKVKVTWADGAYSSKYTIEAVNKNFKNGIWEKYVEKEYEILAFIRNNDDNSKAAGAIKIKDKDGKFKWNLTDSYDYEETLLKNSKFNIYSIKRLSDGEVFTIWDKVKYIEDNPFSDSPCTISGFKIHNDKIYINRHIHTASTFNREISNLKHIELLFTTEDGVDIYEGDYFCSVFIEDYGSSKAFTLVEVNNADTSYKRPSDRVIDFSTKKAAEEYITLNKPCLSIKEVYENTSVMKSEKLESIVKSRI